MEPAANTGLVIAGAIALGFIVANIYAHLAAVAWERTPYPSGRLVAANGTRLYIRVKGSGAPVILIESGLGSPGAEWWRIQDELSRMTTVVTYDRAGYGWSWPGKFPRTSFQVVSELHSMLQHAGLSGPYILIGHSQGGLYSQLFGRLHPEQVAGAVLLDPISSNHLRFKAELKPEVYEMSAIDTLPYRRIPKNLLRLGLMRVFKSIIQTKLLSYHSNLPATTREVIWQHLALPKAYRAIVSEYEQNRTPANSSDIRSAGTFPPVPLKVIYHSPRRMVREMMRHKGLQRDDAEEVEQIWQQLVRAYLRLTPRSEWIVAPESGHYIHLDQPELVIDEIRLLVLALRSNTPSE